MLSTTWDGLPISPTPPYGAAIVVWRRPTGGLAELLILHRRAVPTDAGDWAWGPPSGARFPGEDIGVTARRELLEETGIDAFPALVAGAGSDWFTYVLEVPHDQPVTLSDEHDRMAWVGAGEAVRRIAPDIVRSQVRLVIAAARLG